MKTCFKCNKRKPLEAFYRHPMMADGHLGKCKECTKKDARSNYSANRYRYKAYDRHREQTQERKQWKLEAQRRYRQRHPDKNRARQLVQLALKTGKLLRSPCVKCGSLRSQAHHPDYSRPLDVVWLCEQHHKEIHKNGF